RYRQAYAFAAAYSTGVMLPMRFEYGWSRRLDAGDDAREPNRFDLSPFVTEVNALKQTLQVLNEKGPQRLASGRDDAVMVLLRRRRNGGDPALVLVNTNARARGVVDLDTLLPHGLSAHRLTEVFPERRSVSTDRFEVDPLAVHVLVPAPVAEP